MPSKKGLRIGHAESGEVLHYGGQGHGLLLAPTGSGKGRDIVVPAALEWPESAVIVDVKAELFCVTAKQRQKFGEVRRLDPYDLAGKLMGKDVPVPPSRYNPMARLRAGSIEFSVEAEKNSDALIWEESGSYSYFTHGARSLVSLAQMGLVEQWGPHEHTLNAVRDVITGAFHGGSVDIFSFAESIMGSSTNQALRQKAAKFCVAGAKESRSLNDIISTADVQTSFLSDAALASCLSASDFSFADLKKEKRPITVYVILPLSYMDVSSKFFRLIVSAALSELLV